MDRDFAGGLHLAVEKDDGLDSFQHLSLHYGGHLEAWVEEEHINLQVTDLEGILDPPDEIPIAVSEWGNKNINLSLPVELIADENLHLRDLVRGSSW